MESFKKYLAEFIGTAILVIGGCGTAVTVGTMMSGAAGGLTVAVNIVAVSLAFGLSIVAMAYSIGEVSGCHVNPAVSLGMLISGKMNLKDFIGYVVAQLAGATAGSGLIWLLTGSNENLGANSYGRGVSPMGIGAARSGIIEIVLTFIFVLVVLSVTSKAENSKIAGLVTGLTLTLVHLVGIPFTGTSVNPARSFGPAILQGGLALRHLYVFIIAPLIGAALAALVYRFLIKKRA